MVSKSVSFLVMCFMVLTGITSASSHPLDEITTQSCYYEGKAYPVGDFVPQENCTMLCFCHGYGPPSPCVPMCQRLPVPTCEIGKELYSYDDEEDQYGCRCKMTVCRDED